MTDIRYEDLLDEVNCADSCEAIISFCELVDNLVKEIQHLELECISTRYLLSQHMDEESGKLLQMDILENLGRRFRDDPGWRRPHGISRLSCQSTEIQRRELALLVLIDDKSTVTTTRLKRLLRLTRIDSHNRDFNESLAFLS